MNQLHFCRDGVLRRTMMTHEDAGFVVNLLPLQAWEAASNKHIFLQALHDVVVLEAGLTVGELFTNLEPWAENMTGIACMDFPAFIEEMRNIPDDFDDDISKVILEYGISIDAVPCFERDDEIDDRNTFSIGRPVPTGRLMIDRGWSMTAIVKAENRDDYYGEESVSLSLTPLSEWQHVEIKISTKAMLRDATAWDKNAVYLGTEESLTKAGHQNVDVVLSRAGHVTGHNIAIDPEAPTFFDAIVRGFLWDVGFHYSPAERSRTLEKVVGSIEQLNAGEDFVPSAGEHDEGSEMKGIRDKIAKAADRMGLPVVAPEIVT